jgi:hypothetical protein
MYIMKPYVDTTYILYIYITGMEPEWNKNQYIMKSYVDTIHTVYIYNWGGTRMEPEPVHHNLNDKHGMMNTRNDPLISAMGETNTS